MCTVRRVVLLLVVFLITSLSSGQYRTCVLPCVHRLHPSDVIPCQHVCYGPYGAFPCHPAGDAVPCMHAVHPYGDIVYC